MQQESHTEKLNNTILPRLILNNDNNGRNYAYFQVIIYYKYIDR